jgi:hypothetical protein
MYRAAARGSIQHTWVFCQAVALSEGGGLEQPARDRVGYGVIGYTAAHAGEAEEKALAPQGVDDSAVSLRVVHHDENVPYGPVGGENGQYGVQVVRAHRHHGQVVEVVRAQPFDDPRSDGVGPAGDAVADDDAALAYLSQARPPREHGDVVPRRAETRGDNASDNAGAEK